MNKMPIVTFSIHQCTENRKFYSENCDFLFLSMKTNSKTFLTLLWLCIFCRRGQMWKNRENPMSVVQFRNDFVSSEHFFQSVILTSIVFLTPFLWAISYLTTFRCGINSGFRIRWENAKIPTTAGVTARNVTARPCAFLEIIREIFIATIAVSSHYWDVFLWYNKSIEASKTNDIGNN